MQAGWLRLNMGNIHLEQEQYAQAVKMYRMALDQLPPALKRMRLNVQRNIGIAFLRSGRYQDALDAFATIVADGPDHQTAFNLVLCCWAMRDVELMKLAFVQLAQVGAAGRSSVCACSQHPPALRCFSHAFGACTCKRQSAVCAVPVGWCLPSTIAA